MCSRLRYIAGRNLERSMSRGRGYPLFTNNATHSLDTRYLGAGSLGTVLSVASRSALTGCLTTNCRTHHRVSSTQLPSISSSSVVGTSRLPMSAMISPPRMSDANCEPVSGDQMPMGPGFTRKGGAVHGVLILMLLHRSPEWKQILIN